MNFGSTSASGASGFHRRQRISSWNAHQQILFLESFFKECPYPNEQQRKQISDYLRIDPRQIKDWFQNRRTRQQYEQADYNLLHHENERLKSENLAMKKALQDVLSHTCGGESVNINALQSYLVKVQLENDSLKKECERLAAQVSELTGKPFSKVDSGGDSNIGMRGAAFQKGDAIKSSTFATEHTYFIPNVENSAMMETARAATDVLLKLLLSIVPFWKNNNGRYSLDRDCYEEVFSGAYPFKQSITGKLESSKHLCDVPINATVLVHMMLDSRMWLDLFPTLVMTAETLDVVEAGMPGSRSGSLHLMHEVMHTLSPLVAPREFNFLRYCHQVDVDTWVIVDVSHETARENDGNVVPHCRKLPSGCMIQDMPDGHSKVTWVELVEVDDRIATHPLYRDLVTSGLVFGAERWIATLKHICERAVIASEEPARGALLSVEGKMSLMDLSYRMVIEFCATSKILNNNLGLDHVLETDENEVRVSSRKCTDPHIPEGLVFCAATSLWLPVCPQRVFAFLKDKSMRSQWDFFWHGPVTEIARVASGRHSGNRISVFKHQAPDESHIAILQESFSDLQGYYLVFAPVELSTINMAVTGVNTSNEPLLPSGFVITGDGCGASPTNPNSTSSNEDGGSLLTVVFQMVFDNPAITRKKHARNVADMKDLVSSTVKKIKALLMPGGTVFPPASNI